ncbi:MAG: Cephalosporin hydroxylase [Parcubacteria group bacterium ADurb.Bin216]|nr:MAG: Cephalosporin hydroxylase [Parcubacteria group bacterium ADurb.Bin216]
MIRITSNELAAQSVYMYGAMQKPEEFSRLLELVDVSRPRVILEIGVGNCGSTWAWSKLDSVEEIICIDLPSGNWGGNEESLVRERLQWIANSSQAKITYIAGNSQSSECLEKVKGLVSEVDFLFIDGDHSYEGVKTDFLTYSPLVKKPGLIAFHDIAEHAPETGCEVKRFWDEVKVSGIPEDQYSEFILQDGKAWAGIGVVRW